MNKTLGDKFHQILQHQKTFTTTSQQNLPTISLNQLESKVNIFKKKKHEKQNLIDQAVNHKEINVCSPFYDRMKTHKQNCKCPYHRKQRLSLIPVRHTQKTSQFRVHEFHRNTSYDKSEIALRKHRNESHLFKKSSNYFNKSMKQELIDHSYTQPIDLEAKTSSHNDSYEQFMKDCEYFLLRKKGFSSGKPNHIVRKGVKEIFQFINNHLEYSVEKMTSWVNSIEKDKDYGYFYVERFKEMKINYEANKNKKMNKTLSTSSFGNLLNRTHKLNSQKFKFTHSTSNFSKPKPSRYKKPSKQGVNSSQESQNQCQSSSEHISSESEFNDSEISLQKIVDELKLKQKISSKTTERLMNKGLDSFKQLFDNLQKNIMKQKYSDDLLQKFDNGVLDQLLKRYSNNKSIKGIQAKLQIITKARGVLKRYRTRKSSNNSNKTNSHDNLSNSKGFISSKRNTQNGQNNKTSNSLYSHSKKPSDNCSVQGSQTNLKDQNDNYHAIEEDQDQLEEDGPNGQKNTKTINNHCQNIRRSRLLKGDEFDLNQIRASNISYAESTDRDFQKQRHAKEAHKGFFTKAQKYLFDINMGKTIVNKEDSIFTAKRKVRVMKMLLKENPNTSQADQLKNYIRTIELKIFLKTQKDKNLLNKSSETQGMSDQEIWKLISLDNLGYNLIFYNLSSKINVEDNEDLCILLNEIKMNGIKNLQNNVTYKSHFIAEEDVEQEKKKKKKTKLDDIFVQDGMSNMQFEPKIQQKSDINIIEQTKRTTRTKQQNLKELKKLAKNTRPNQTSLNFQLDDMDDGEMQKNYQQVKRMLKYAKVHLSETFQKYLKNTSIYSVSQMNSFIEY